MRVTRKKSRDQPLAEFPRWGLEIMMGLYGEQQVRDALAVETASPHGIESTSDTATTPSATPSATNSPVAGSVGAAEFDAVSSVFDRVRRLRRR